MADKGHKALFNDSQVLISWGKEHHRLKKKKMLPFPQVANGMVATHRQINALLWAQLRLYQTMSSATAILEKEPTHMRKMCITCRKHALNGRVKERSTSSKYLTDLEYMAKCLYNKIITFKWTFYAGELSWRGLNLPAHTIRNHVQWSIILIDVHYVSIIFKMTETLK